VSACGKYVACAATCNNICIWKVSATDKKQQKLVKKLPRHICPATAIAFRPDTPILTIAYSDHEILQFNVVEQSLKKLHLTNSLLAPSHPISNIVFDPKNPEVVVVHNDTMLCSLLQQLAIGGQTPTDKNSKKKKPNNENAVQQSGLTTKLVKRYKHLVHIGWLDENEMVAVEVNPVTLIEQLPPGLKHKKYGAS
jgi:hypothetical protein